MNIYLIRHGETFANENHQFAGVWDVELNERGRLQAEIIGEKLKDIEFDAIHVSSLKRAQDTCKAIVRSQKAKAQISDQLMEMNFGNWEGLQFSQIKAKEPDLLAKWFEDFKGFKVPGGESTLDMYARVTSYYQSVINSYDQNATHNILFVAHGGVIQALLSYILHDNLDGYWKYQVDNCGLNKIEYVMGTPVLKSLNK